jgi:hypothetical protein
VTTGHEGDAQTQWDGKTLFCESSRMVRRSAALLSHTGALTVPSIVVHLGDFSFSPSPMPLHTLGVRSVKNSVYGITLGDVWSVLMGQLEEAG